MAKKPTKTLDSTRLAAAPATGAVPPVDPIPTTAPAKTSKPRATAVPRGAKAAAAAALNGTTPSAAATPAEISDAMVAERAYHKWINGEAGDHYDHWIAAERELRGR